MAVVELKRCLVILIILYVFAALFAVVAAIPMIMHVYPQSECLLFSSEVNQKLFYGHYASCNVVGWVFPFVAIGAAYLIFRAAQELRKLKGHHPQGPYVEDKVPSDILWAHVVVMSLALLLTMITTIGYVSACSNLNAGVRTQVTSKLNEDPYNTRGEEIQTRYEDDYKFHRYTNRYGNAFGSEFYTIRITCRSILTDPEIHQKLHDSHYEQQSRYYGYWYGTDLFAYDSQYEAQKTNALVETCMAGSWLGMAFWLGGFILILVQKYIIRKQKLEQDRMSVHSTMMGSGYPGYDGSVMSGSQFRNGSMYSGRASNFQRGGSMRGSDRSIKSTKREIDDMAINNILSTGGTLSRPVNTTSYGRKDFDDMVINQYMQQQQQQPAYRTPQQQHRSIASSRETGYISDSAASASGQPFIASYPGGPAVTRSDEHETEIF